MTITNGYCTLAEAKVRLDLDPAVLSWDSSVEQLVEAVSRWIDGHTGRVFYATTATRYFTALEEDLLVVDDLLSVTTLKTLTANVAGSRTYGAGWAAADYDLMPYNSSPKVMVAANPAGAYRFPVDVRGVEIAGSWGYSATVPADIREACLIQCGQEWGVKGAPFDDVKAPDVGESWMVAKINPRVWQMLQRFRLVGLGVV